MADSFHDDSQLRESTVELTLADLWGYLKARWYLPPGIGAFFGLTAAVLSLMFPDIYRSSTIVAPSDQVYTFDSGQAGSGLLNGSILGIGRGAKLVDPVDKTLATLTSREFVLAFLNRHGILPELVAAEFWDEDTGELEWDNSVYDEDSNTWLSDSDGQSLRPNPTEAFEIFLEHFEVDRSFETGLITLAFEHVSPTRAREILDNIVVDLNSHTVSYYSKKLDAEISAFRATLDAENIPEIRSALASRIIDRLEQRSLLIAGSSTALEILDPPHLPDEKARPFRTLITLAAGVSGFAIGIAILILVGALGKRDEL